MSIYSASIKRPVTTTWYMLPSSYRSLFATTASVDLYPEVELPSLSCHNYQEQVHPILEKWTNLLKMHLIR
jgi:hypothetical protein